LIDDARGILDGASPARAWKLLSSPERSVPTETFCRPGIWFVLREATAERVKQCQAEARTRVAAIAEDLRTRSPFPEPPLYLSGSTALRFA